MTTPDTGEAAGPSEARVLLTPDQQLAEHIATELIENGLILAERRDSLCAKLSTGQMKPEDWRLLAVGAIRSKKEREGEKQ